MDRFRFLDILLALPALLLLLPFFILIALYIKLDSRGTVFFRQSRVGWRNKDFMLYKFRTMVPGAVIKGTLTIGDHDDRVTKAGSFLRKWKIDELPQLWNVLIGDMSMVGPRPELRKYVAFYTDEEMEILQVKPGITDYASLFYRQEGQLLSRQVDPEKYYIEVIMPHKVKLNKKYIQEKSIKNYFRIIISTILSIVSSEQPDVIDKP